MRVSIVAIGSEMLGTSRQDTNSLKITAALEDHGVTLVRKCVVGDSLDDLVAEISFTLANSDVVVTTGGLGPTEDDLTREALAVALGLEFEVDQSIIDRIASRFAARGWKMPEVNKRQGKVFRGQTTLANERGTAPGFHIESLGKHVWVFPGVPNELEWMVETYLRPWLAGRNSGKMNRRVLKIAGMSESGVEERLKPYYERRPGEPLTILASAGAVELHLLHQSADEVGVREGELVELFAERIFGYDDDSLESVVGALLAARGETLATAESCTGGLLGSRITDIPGSSKYYRGGVVCYDANAKIDLAGVDPSLIRDNGEVSEEVAIALARGIRERFGATYGVGVTGIAGPTGGSDAKPVGTVHIAVADGQRHKHRKMFWPSARTLVKWFSTQWALDMLRLFITRDSSRA
ncbi:MAG TPA: CinA family nicotinamide mononucleotide deamidase-related protein [Thermoanaerobaculia bacterium]|nr:CinA family nicotinamide mononucleotide deamidase-related protein [Thermoanaerobaculia bacterium]